MTYRTEACPCCRGTSWEAFPAIVSPFLASYALGARPGPTRLLACHSCGFRFFEDRLTDSEAARLYSGYRGEDYYRARHRFEPWYTRAANDGIGGDAATLERRRATIARVVRRKVARVGEVLDYGGDRGQFIPDGIAERRSVYEISGVPPEPGVEAISDPAQLKARRFDLVLLCHVLEHLSEPRTVLEEVRPLLRNRDALLYIELPFERSNLRWLGRGRAYEGYLRALRSVPPLLMAVDLYSTVFRLKTNLIPPLGLAKLHEHINFFDEPSLRALLDTSGFETVSVGTEELESSIGKQTVLCALARVTSA